MAGESPPDVRGARLVFRYGGVLPELWEVHDMRDDWEIVRDGIISDEFGTRQVHLDLAALDRIEAKYKELQKQNDMLRDRNASKRSENVLYVQKLDEARHVVDVMHRTYHTGVSDCPCREILGLPGVGP